MSQTKIGSGFIEAGAISANTILSTGVITADLIATGAVGPTELATGAVSANTKIGTVFLEVFFIISAYIFDINIISLEYGRNPVGI